MLHNTPYLRMLNEGVGIRHSLIASVPRLQYTGFILRSPGVRYLTIRTLPIHKWAKTEPMFPDVPRQRAFADTIRLSTIVDLKFQYD